jgi:hypothetical protein
MHCQLLEVESVDAPVTAVVAATFLSSSWCDRTPPVSFRSV